VQKSKIIATQLDFYRKGLAGCMFAAHAAQDPGRYEWRFDVCDAEVDKIENLIQTAIDKPDVSTQSIIFPAVANEGDLILLLRLLLQVPSISLGQEEQFEDTICLGYRVAIGHLKSWVTGFGQFTFLPKTRQTVYTEIVFRTKPRPLYEKTMKPSPDGIVHLADMDMKQMKEKQFKALWRNSFDNTEKHLGAKPDLRSAAKTTFSIPSLLWRDS
jgi:hypothetical protein